MCRHVACKQGCESKTVCSVCGKVLCTWGKDFCVIEGHFCKVKKCYCTECWDKSASSVLYKVDLPKG